MNNDKRVFIDTSAWIMLLNADEKRHMEAAEAYNNIRTSERYTSNLVIGETYTWLRMRVGYSKAIEFLQAVNTMYSEKMLVIVWSDCDIENRAGDYLRKFSDQDLSFTDAVSFVIMINHEIKAAFTFDKHFTVAGFLPINPL